MDLSSIDRLWFLTWTTYGTWLPGDDRGFVSPKFEGDSRERRHNAPGDPYDSGRRELRRLTEEKLAGPPVRLSSEQARVVRVQFEDTARYRGWRILAGAIMENHVHLVVAVRGDPDPASLMRDFKSYASRALNSQFGKPKSGKWWTEQGSKRKIRDWENLAVLQRYVREQKNSLEAWEEDGMVAEEGKREGGIAGRKRE